MNNNKTLDTALLSLSAGCLVISIYEIISRGLPYAYVWLMLTLVLWLWYSMRRRRSQEKEQAAGKLPKEGKQGKARGSKTKRNRK